MASNLFWRFLAAICPLLAKGVRREIQNRERFRQTGPRFRHFLPMHPRQSMQERLFRIEPLATDPAETQSRN